MAPRLAAQIPDPDQRQLLNTYAAWRLLRDLRAISADTPIGHYRNQIARRRLRVAADFLDVLHSRDLLLSDCTQAALDEWFAQATAPDKGLQRHFLRWARQTQRMPWLELPVTTANTPTPITQQERVEWIRRIYSGEEMDLTERVVALLVLLYAQPLSKVARLTVDDITVADGQMLLRLGDLPAPVPPPFDELLSQHLAARPNLMTATNPNSRWLFPGRREGEPMYPTTFRLRFQKLGIPNLTGRSRALRAMLLQAPPAVVAGMLGYRPDTAEQIARGAGATWQHYAPGDHNRTRLPRVDN